jgi:hypothetical protein
VTFIKQFVSESTRNWLGSIIDCGNSKWNSYYSYVIILR